MELPQNFKIKMEQLLKEEYAEYLKTFKQQRLQGLRINPLKITPQKLCTLLNQNLEQVPWCAEGYYYNDNIRPAKSPYYHAGLYYIQEPSAMSAVETLGIKENDYVLDICAAPGGKSTQIGAKLGTQGLLISNDASTKRTKALIKNIELFGIKNAIVLNENPMKLKNKFPAFFDKILVDAPCSGEGMFRKNAESIKSWEEYKSEDCQKLQKEILSCAAEMLKAGGKILYSTCTFNPEENEGIIQQFLEKNKQYELIPINKKQFDSGRPEWITNGNATLTSCARLWPHKIKGEGHFLALLQKKSNENNAKQDTHIKNTDSDMEYYYAFMKEYMNIIISKNLCTYGNYLYSMPQAIDLSTIKVIRPGWLLGELKKKRFEPSQSLAMAIRKEDAKQNINFSADSAKVIKYLKGETLDIEGEEGWNLITVEGYPLGWGKIQNGRLKNKYLANWKWE